MAIQFALLGAGVALQGYGALKANRAQADAEAQNASFYREQAAFAELSGVRKREIFDRESKVLFGEQLSAFARSGIDTANSANFLAKEMLFRHQESWAIKQEADFNVRLAMLRADQADKTAKHLKDPMTAIASVLGPGLSAAGALSGRKR